MIQHSIEIEIKPENCFLHIFVFAQYFSNALFWVPYIAEITKPSFYRFDFVCMKNEISNISLQLVRWKKGWIFEKILWFILLWKFHMYNLMQWDDEWKKCKKLLFSFVKCWAEDFLTFTYTFEETLKKWFQSFTKVTYTLVITIFEILFKLAFKDFPGRRRAKCTKLSRCCFHQYFCKPKFIIFFQEFCPRNKLFWKLFP